MNSKNHLQYTNKQAGYNVSSYRKKKGLSQYELSDLTGISRPSISNIEKGRQALSICNLLKICRHLNCTPDQILGFALAEIGEKIIGVTLSDEDILKIRTSGDPCVCKENIYHKKTDEDFPSVAVRIPDKVEAGEFPGWATVINDSINVPDHLDELVNSIGFQVRMHTISQAFGEAEMVCRIARIAELFFSKHPPPPTRPSLSSQIL